jgi:hypothetical protein
VNTVTSLWTKLRYSALASKHGSYCTDEQQGSLEIWNEVNRLHLMNEGLKLRRKEVVLVPCSTEMVFLF